jgi:hypothetical protein
MFIPLWLLVLIVIGLISYLKEEEDAEDDNEDDYFDVSCDI